MVRLDRASAAAALNSLPSLFSSCTMGPIASETHRHIGSSMTQKDKMINLTKLSQIELKKGNMFGYVMYVRLPRHLNVSLLERFLLTAATAWHAAVRTLSFSCMRRSVRAFSTFRSCRIFLFSPLWREKKDIFTQLKLNYKLEKKKNMFGLLLNTSSYYCTLSDKM